MFDLAVMSRTYIPCVNASQEATVDEYFSKEIQRQVWSCHCHCCNMICFFHNTMWKQTWKTIPMWNFYVVFSFYVCFNQRLRNCALLEVIKYINEKYLFKTHVRCSEGLWVLWREFFFSFFFLKRLFWKKNDGILQIFLFEKSKETDDL